MTRSIPYTTVIIDRFNDAEVAFWANDLEVEPNELRAAIGLVGTRLTQLRRHFGKSARVLPLDNWRGPGPSSRTA